MKQALLRALLGALLLLHASLALAGGPSSGSPSPGYALPFQAPGATSSRSTSDRAGDGLTPYDFASANSDGVAHGDFQRWPCNVVATGPNTATITGTNCTFSQTDVGKYAGIYDWGVQLTTAPIVGGTVTAGGSFTALPTILASDTGNGNGAVAQALGGLSTSVVNSGGGGTGCPNGTITFNVLSGTFTTQAQVTGVVANGVLSGLLVNTTLGVYSSLPPTSAAQLAPTSGSCTTPPTIATTWQLVGVNMVAIGYNYSAPQLTATTGGATLTATLGTPAFKPYTSTIQSVSGSNSVTFSGTPFSNTPAGTHIVFWSHDDYPALRALILAAQKQYGSVGSCANIPQPPNGQMWGVATQLTLRGDMPFCVHQIGGIASIAPASNTLTQTDLTNYSTTIAAGGEWIGMNLDGNKLATNVANLVCPQQQYFPHPVIGNAAPYGTIAKFGSTTGPVCVASWVKDIWTYSLAGLYNGSYDRPLIALDVAEPDLWVTGGAITGASYAQFQSESTASDLHLTNLHAWMYPGPSATIGFNLKGGCWCTGIVIDGAQTYAILDESVNGGLHLENGGILATQPIPTYGVYFTGMNPPNNTISTTFDMSVLTSGDNAIVFANGSGVNSGWAGSNCLNGDATNACGGTHVGVFWSTLVQNTVAYGLYALHGGSPTSYLYGGGHTAVGAYAGTSLTGNSVRDDFFGEHACDNVIVVSNVLCLGNYTVGPTPTTSSFMNIGNLIYNNMAATALPSWNCGNAPTLAAHSNGHFGQVKCGTVANNASPVTSALIAISPSYQIWMFCPVTPQSNVAFNVDTSILGQIAITGTDLRGVTFTYNCEGVMNEKTYAPPALDTEFASAANDNDANFAAAA
jgi:hypothetical protein